MCSGCSARPATKPSPHELDAILASHAGADSVVLGRGIADRWYSPFECPSDEICLFGLHKFELQVTRTIAGPSVKGHVRALIVAEALLLPKYVPKFELFVLRPIGDTHLSKA